MKAKILIPLVCFLLLSPHITGFLQASEIDNPALAQILEQATRNNPTIRASAERVRQARAQTRASTADMGPRIAGTLGSRWNKDEPSLLASGRSNTYTATLSLIQTVYAGRTLVANQRAANLALAAAREEGARTYQNVLGMVRAGYFDALRAHSLLGVRREALGLSREHLRQVEALFRGGLVPMGDVLRVQVSVSQGEIDELRAASNLEVSWRTLERRVGAKLARADVFKPLTGDEGIALRPPRYVPPDNPVECALAQRPELKTYAYYKRRADELARAAAGEFLPRIQLNAQAANTDDRFFPGGNDDWYVALNLQWTLFDSGKTAAGVSRTRAAARELAAQIDDMTAQIELEVETAEANLRSATSRLALAEEQILKAQEDYGRTVRRYEAQMSTNLDVLDSQMALANSRTEYVNAVCDIAEAQASLIFALGADDLPPGLFR